MIIQLNTDHNIDGNEKLRVHLNDLITEELRRFSDHITRIEVHLADEDGNKNGQNDIRCTMEARFEGLKPISVTNHANTNELAVDGALDKLKHSLDSIVGRLNHH